MLIRELTEVDAAQYNAFFADGVARHPRTLRIAVADIAAQPFVTAPSTERVTLAAVEEAEWLGVGTLEREAGRLKRRHLAWIVRMYVARAGHGVGRAILRELITRARHLPGIAKLNLTVAAENHAAVHLYESEGFVTFAREDDGFRVGEEGVTELTMSLRL